MTLAANAFLTAKAGDKELHLHLKNGTVTTSVLSVKKEHETLSVLPFVLGAR